MARYRPVRNRQGVPSIQATPESIAAPPTLEPAPQLVEFTKPLAPPDDPVIVSPENTATQWSFQQWFREAVADLSASFVQMYAASVLALHAYRLSRSDAFQNLAEQALEGVEGGRLLVDVGNNRWIDTYKYPDGRQIWVIPGTISTVKTWIGYAIPGMAPVQVNSGTFNVYAGLKSHLDAYWDYVRQNTGSTQNIPERGLTIIGHSMGGAVAQYLAFRLNQARAEANPTAPAYLVNRVNTLGAPAFMHKGTVVGGLVNGYKHTRAYNPGDPIPNMLISGFIAAVAVGRYVTALNQSQAPAHYHTVDFPIQPSRSAKDVDGLILALQTARGFYQPTSLFSTRTAQEILAAKRGDYDAGAHSVRNYADRLELICRSLTDCPYPLFSRLVTMSRMVDL